MTTAVPDKVNLTKYIEMRDDRPNIRGRRVPVMFIVAMERENQFSVSQIAYQYTISEAEVLAALLYYREHKAEMDAQDASDLQEDEAFFRLHARKPGQA